MIGRRTVARPGQAKRTSLRAGEFHGSVKCPPAPPRTARPRMDACSRMFFFFQAEDGIRDYKVTGVQTCALPISSLTSDAVEGGATLFEVKYFDQKAYLTQSWQLYAEALIASVGRIYTVAPSFRAEKSRTRRHLTEYWHVEAEAPWCDLNCIIEVEEQLLSYIVATLVEKCKTELTLFERKTEDLEKVKPPFERITYDQAFKMIGEEKSGIKWGDDLGYEQEKLLTAKFDRLFFVTHYPKKAKAFYHMPDPSNPDVTLSVDCL